MIKGIIELEEMEFYAYHGCFKEEQVVGNRFIVNVTLQVDVERATQSDNIQDALNYVTVYEIVKKEINKKSHLLEHLTQRIIESIYETFSYIIHLKVKVCKVNPPMGGQMKNVALTLEK